MSSHHVEAFTHTVSVAASQRRVTPKALARCHYLRKYSGRERVAERRVDYPNLPAKHLCDDTLGLR